MSVFYIDGSIAKYQLMPNGVPIHNKPCSSLIIAVTLLLINPFLEEYVLKGNNCDDA